MPQALWINRKFDFPTKGNILPAIIERLEGTPLRLAAKVQDLPAEVLLQKPGGRWSLKEHIGHLSDLEPLWMGRLEEILSGVGTMRPADMSNQKTNEARHNEWPIATLLHDFNAARQKMVLRLRGLPEPAAFSTALHPRLQKPMRVMDLFQFVAEHDDHHLARMTELLQ